MKHRIIFGRIFLPALMVAASGALPIHGQTAAEQRIVVAGRGTADAEAPAPAAGLGWSGAIRVVVAGMGESLDPSLLSLVGQGWERGHRWRLLHGSIKPFVAATPAAPAVDSGPRVLGVPVEAPEEPATPPEAGPSLTAAPAADSAAGSADAVLGVPAPSVLGEPAPSARAEPGTPPRNGVAPTVLGEPTASASTVAGGTSAPLLTEAITAPTEPGVWLLESATGATATVITQVPASRRRNGILNGYRIGNYPTENSGRADAYAPPIAFIEVTPENRDLRISDHLTLGQFLTKDQFEVWPKYVALDLRLIDKLELVIDELAAMGIRAENIHVMSGFRTPLYNGPGGDGRAALSRHMWGDAADVWIDNDGDGDMDDLNGDGRVDLNDAAVIMRAVDRVERRYPELIGGAGIYPTAPHHPPYIHIDARGHHSRW